MAATPPVCTFGQPAPAFDLIGTDGKRYALDTVRGENGLLVMFICNHCPYVKAVLDKLVRDARDLAAHGIGSVAICSNDAADYPEDSFANMAALSERMRFPFPYLWDETQSVAKAFGAVCTPDFFGFNASLELQYRGRLDDAGRSLRPDAPRELYHAMVEISRTGKAPARQTPSVGCSIKWRAAA
jgi:peroxiredoxin